jgi:hypothetical protein
MALTKGGSTNDGAAQYVSPPGATRQGRIGNIATEAATASPSSVGEASYGDGFIDGSTLGKPTLTAGKQTGASVSGQGTGFPEVGLGGNYPDSGGNTSPASGPTRVRK